MSGELRYLPFGETRYTSGQTPTSFRYTGQREDSTINLYWYNSRWYDSSLGRWAQPDTLIPSPGNPMAWDRYAYVLNSPVVLVDPTGHSACIDAECTQIQEHQKPIIDVAYYKEKLREKHDITVYGNIGLSDIRTIYQGVLKMNYKLNHQLKRIGKVSIYYQRYTDGTWGGYWNGARSITFSTTNDGQLPAQNVYHEFTHIIDNVMTDGQAGNILNQVTVTDSNGEFVMGLNEKGDYDRQSGLGYTEPCSQGANYCINEQHPRGWEPTGNTGSEEFADIGVNYFNGSINMDSAAGRARYDYAMIFFYPLFFE